MCVIMGILPKRSLMHDTVSYYAARGGSAAVQKVRLVCEHMQSCHYLHLGLPDVFKLVLQSHTQPCLTGA